MKLWLAPLEGVSDCAFRTLCHNHGADMTFTPMLRADALVRKNNATVRLLDINSKAPTTIQLLATKPETLKAFVQQFPDYNMDAAGFNLNCGCPSPDVIREGGGAALMKRTKRLNELLDVLRKLDKPVSIKMRLGLNVYEKEKKVYLNTIKEVNADYFIVHARHARQTSDEPADRSVYQECIDTGKHIIPNGDITSKDDIEHFKLLNIQEVMIGRAAVKNPAIFNFLNGQRPLGVAEMQAEYTKLAQKYTSLSKFRDTVLKYIGKDIHSSKWMV